MYNTDFSQFRNTDEIDISFGEYVNKKNNSPHASLNGQTPVNVFMDDDITVRRVDLLRLEELFYHTANRKVGNDATVRLNTRIYETSQEYIGKSVTLKYKPDLSRVFIYDSDETGYKEIYEVKKIDNSRIRRNKPLFSQED